MRCPDCNKFVSFDAEVEPEVQESFDPRTGVVSIDVRIVNACAECGAELKEASFQFEAETALRGPGLELEVEATRAERGEGKGRYRKQFYGVEVAWRLEHPEDGEVAGGTFEDYCQASAMDELV